MAGPYYWVGGSGNSSDATNHWATASGGAPNAANVPTSADDVHFNANSNATAYTVTFDSTLNCKDLKFDAAPSGSGTITIAGGATINCYGNVLLLAGMTINYGSTIVGGALVLRATSGTKTITNNGVNWAAPITFNGAGGTFQLADNLNLTTGCQLTLTAGAFDPNGKAVIFNGGPSDWYHYNNSMIAGAFSFYDLTFIGDDIWANNSNNLCVESDFTVTRLLTITGGSKARFGVFSYSAGGPNWGTPRTITAAAVSLTNVDFVDITGAGAAAWNGASVADCGGNSNITFSAPVTRYWIGNTGDWTDTAHWSAADGGAGGASMPTPNDNVRLTANSFTVDGETIICTKYRWCKNFDSTGVLHTPSLSSSGLGNRHVGGFYGSVNSTGMKTDAIINTSGVAPVLMGRGSFTLTTGGVAGWEGFNVHAPGGTYTLQDAYTASYPGWDATLAIFQGTFDANGFSVTIAGIVWVYGGLLKMGSGMWTLTRGLASISVFRTYSPAYLNCGASTLKLTDASSTVKMLQLAGATLNNIWLSGAGTGVFQFLDSCTLNVLIVDTPPHSVQLAAGATMTLNDLSASGTAGNLITIGSITAADHTLVNAGTGFPVAHDYLSISRSQASPAGKWYAGSHSTDGGNNAGWSFTDAPPPPDRMLGIFGT